MPATSPGSETDDDDDLAPSPAGAPNAKLQRWIDLLAALLVRTHPATFEELAKDVPEYGLALGVAERESDGRKRATAEQSVKRAFERDKDELRALGVSIESVPDEHGNAGGAYRLRRRDFYLPYLAFAVPGGAVQQPRTVDRWGYQALTSLTFEPDELQAVVDAAACVRALGDPLLAMDTEHALRKLAVDLPVAAAAAASAEPRVVLPRARADAATFEALGDALARRKRVAFGYHAMSTDRTEPREAEPYGLFFLGGHWYLVARDVARDALRNFRLDRMTGAKANAKRGQSPDYEIPGEFRLRDHARSRHAWELGDGDSSHAVVEFRGRSGPAAAAARLGAEVDGAPHRRAFQVRRADAFVRWLLSFAGEAVPVEPAEIVARFHEEARRTAAMYASDDPTSFSQRVATTGTEAPPAARTRAPKAADAWQPKGAAAQLRRVLHVIPQLADGEEHALDQVAARVGTDAATLRRDLYSLVARFDAPPGFVEGVQLYVEKDRVSAVSNHFLRPMRLTVPELCALELGLAALRVTRPPDEHAALDRARDRLTRVIARLPGDPIPDGLYGAALGEHGSTAHLAAVRTALRGRRKLRLAYRKSGGDGAEARVVCPHALVAASGMLYVVAYCDTRQGLRVFRLDRVEGAEALEETFVPMPGFSLDEVLKDGRVFVAPDAPTMRVRYSARIARWIAEREGRAPREDGTLDVEHPLADPEWGMRHVLQYGPDAEVLAPGTLRAALRERVGRMAGDR